MPYLSSWRSRQQAPSPEQPPKQVGTDRTQLYERAKQRLSAMAVDDLLDFVEVNMGAIGRHIRDWRSTQNVEHLYEARLASELQDVAMALVAQRVR